MRKKLAVLFASIAVATAGVFGGMAASSHTPTAQAFIFAGSCSWPTSSGWYWSNGYHVYLNYQGHTFINGHNFRHYLIYTPLTGLYDHWYVYCG